MVDDDDYKIDMMISPQAKKSLLQAEIRSHVVGKYRY